MARRKSEGNMFLSSQESANISGNEKKAEPLSAPSAPADHKLPAAKSTKKPVKTPVSKEKTALPPQAVQKTVIEDIESNLPQI